ncbi:hypothetical protein [Teredinibacter franksiae]|uniref:hypothetical protein n=1 Tax=Teredinibacter franksiae TaxID=2761453 RepID=UPI0016265A79|nr:hypothetical protein [Teredinibacter franksiae]
MLHRSPGLTAIYNEIKKSKRNRILDLGSMAVSNFNFFSSLSCKIHFENLNEFVEDNARLSTGNLIFKLNKFLLSHEPEEKFDVILAWDLLNYLPVEVIESLFGKLNNWCHPNTLLHTVRYLNSNISSQPAVFEIIDQYHIQISAYPITARRFPLHKTAALLKHIPQYFLHNNLMNEAGMETGIGEQVLRYMPEKSQRKQYISSTGINNVIPGDEREKPLDSSLSQQLKLYKSPAIEQILHGNIRKRILDLGRKSTRNLEFWRKHFSEVHSEDLASSIRWHTTTADLTIQADDISLSEEALNFNHDLLFDVIVLWDIPNYCNQIQLKAIGDRLKKHCNKHTQILIFSYLGNFIPPQPQSFNLQGNGKYHAKEAGKRTRDHSAITTSGIMKLIPGWKIVKTHIFSDGMKPGLVELIFEYTELLTGSNNTDTQNNAEKQNPQSALK